jgi:hypothetical protein
VFHKCKHKLTCGTFEEAPNREGLPPSSILKKSLLYDSIFSTNITLYIGLIIILTRLWFKRMVFPTYILEIL